MGIVPVLRVIAGDRPVAGSFKTPLKWPHLSVCGSGTQKVLPIVHPLRIEFPHESSTSLREAVGRTRQRQNIRGDARGEIRDGGLGGQTRRLRGNRERRDRW